MQGARRRGGIAAVAGFLAVATVGIPVTAETSTIVPAAKEAWYATPLTALPNPGAEVSPYPAGTLHTGVTAGQEDSRTYLAFDTSDLPAAGAAVSGATLVLPVAPDAGTHGADVARLRVCLAGELEDEAHGSTAAPPAVDCSLTADAGYDAEREVFEADVLPFVRFLDRSIAVVPHQPATGESWHVAFHGTDSTAADPAPIVLRLEVDLPTVDDGTTGVDTGSGSGTTGGISGSTAPSPSYDSASFAAGIHPEAAAGGAVDLRGDTALESPPPASPAGRVPAQPIASGDGGFSYSVIFLLPLALLLLVPYFGFALSRPTGTRL